MFKLVSRLAAATAIALAAGSALAEAPAPAAAPAAAETKTATPAIWTIAKPGGGTITMFGSVHLLPPNLEWRTAAFNEAFAKADVVTFEMPLDDATSPEFMSYVQQHMMNPPGVTLSTLLTPEEKTRVEAAATAVGAPFGMLEPFRPWMAAIQLSMGFVLKEGFDPNSGVDRKIEAEAKAAGKTLDSFETGKDQIDIFINLPPEQEKAFLVIGAAEMVDNPHMLGELVDSWAAGDTAKIDEVMNSGIESMPDLGKALLEDRNARWVDKITSVYMNDTKNYLVIVGAAHLAGDKGVPTMLRAKGIEVTGP
ncbi:MAG: TraB/GumN family protein [Micropepsaceae bacterium]